MQIQQIYAQLYLRITKDQTATVREVAAAIGRLDERKQRILSLRAQGYSLKEIAAADGYAHPATLSTYIRRALSDVRTLIEEARPGGPDSSVKSPR